MCSNGHCSPARAGESRTARAPARARPASATWWCCSRPAPGHGAVAAVDPVLADAMARQLDLSISRVDTGGMVYANDAWIPNRAVVPPRTDVTAKAGEALSTAASSDVAAVARGVGGRVSPVCGQPGPERCSGREAADSGWHATANGHQLARSKAFDWTNAFALPERALGRAALPRRAHSPDSSSTAGDRRLDRGPRRVAAHAARRSRQSRPWGSGVSAPALSARIASAADRGARDRGGRRGRGGRTFARSGRLPGRWSRSRRRSFRRRTRSRPRGTAPGCRACSLRRIRR